MHDFHYYDEHIPQLEDAHSSVGGAYGYNNLYVSNVTDGVILSLPTAHTQLETQNANSYTAHNLETHIIG